MLKFGFKLLTDINKWADDRSKGVRKALYIAVNEESKRLRKQAMSDLKTGKLGLKPKSRYRNKGIVIRKGQQVYTRLDKRYRAPRGKRAFIPLAGLFSGVTFQLDSSYRDFVAGNRRLVKSEVGFLGQTPGTAWQARIAEKSLKGYRWLYPAHAREYLHAMGIYLRKTTTSGKVPPRDIMGAVRKKCPEYRIMQNIKTLFDRKMRGERI